MAASATPSVAHLLDRGAQPFVAHRGTARRRRVGWQGWPRADVDAPDASSVKPACSSAANVSRAVLAAADQPRPHAGAVQHLLHARLARPAASARARRSAARRRGGGTRRSSAIAWSGSGTEQSTRLATAASKLVVLERKRVGDAVAHGHPHRGRARRGLRLLAQVGLGLERERPRPRSPDSGEVHAVAGADLEHPAGQPGEHLVAVRAGLLLHALAAAIEEAGEDRVPDGGHARTLAPSPHRLARRSVVSSTRSGPGSRVC